MKKTRLIILLLLAFFIFPHSIKAEEIKETNEDTSYTLIIDDQADLLTEEEEIKLKDDMRSLLQYGHIAFVSIPTNSTTADNYASSYYHNHFNTESGTLFLIDMDNRKIYIFSDGENYKFITTSKANIITDNIYKFASREEYYECAKQAYKQIETILEGGKIAEPMRHTSNIVLSLVLAFMIIYFYVTSKSKIQAASSSAILKKCDIAFAVSDIVGTKTGTHKVYNPPSDSGGSSGGGGGGGGGGSSGGGGGHSF